MNQNRRVPDSKGGVTGRAMLLIAVAAALALVTIAIVSVETEKSGADDITGICGDGVGYSLDESTGELKIIKYASGRGNMNDYSLEKPAPWADKSDKILSVVIGSSVASIGKYSFYNCSNMVELKFTGPIKRIGENACDGCKSLVSIRIPELAKIGSNAFKGCTSLTNVTVSFWVNAAKDAFPDHTFYSYDNKLVATDDEDGFSLHKYVGKTPNAMVAADDSGRCGNAVRWIYTIETGELKFIYNGGGSAIDEKSVSNYGWHKHRSTIKSIVFDEGVSEIPRGAFIDCVNLESVKMGKFMQRIGNEAFMNCRSLTSIEIPERVNCVSSDMFHGCSLLKNVKLLGTIYYVYPRAFMNCTSLESIEIPGPAEIRWEAFRNCQALKTIAIPNAKVIFNDAFMNCIQLESITIPTSMRYIGNDAFPGCIRLTKIIVEKGENGHNGIQDRAFTSHKFFKSDGVTPISPSDPDFRGHTYTGTIDRMVADQEPEVEKPTNVSQTAYLPSAVSADRNRFAVY